MSVTGPAFSNLRAKLMQAIEQKARRSPETRSASSIVLGAIKSCSSKSRKSGSDMSMSRPQPPRIAVIVKKLAVLIARVTTSFIDKVNRAPRANAEPVCTKAAQF